MRALRPPALVAAAVVFGGLVMAVWPQHWQSIVQITLASAAVAAGVHVLRANVVHAPERIRPLSPLEHLPPRRRTPEVPADFERTLTNLRGSRHTRRAVTLPWRTTEQLQQAASALLERHGFDPSVAADRAAVEAAVSALTWKILTEPRARHETTRADSLAVARIVHTVLDDLDRLESGQILDRAANGAAPRVARDATAHFTRGVS